MPKGKRGFKCLYSTAPLPAIAATLQQSPLARLLSLLLLLPPAPLVDCCLPPQFLLLSATAIAIVAATATAETASAEAVAITIFPRCRLN
jgi:hypothetical protein